MQALKLDWYGFDPANDPNQADPGNQENLDNIYTRNLCRALDDAWIAKAEFLHNVGQESGHLPDLDSAKSVFVELQSEDLLFHHASKQELLNLKTLFDTPSSDDLIFDNLISELKYNFKLYSVWLMCLEGSLECCQANLEPLQKIDSKIDELTQTIVRINLLIKQIRQEIDKNGA